MTSHGTWVKCRYHQDYKYMKLRVKFKMYGNMHRPTKFPAKEPDAWIWLNALPGSDNYVDDCAFFFDDSVDHIEFERPEDETVYKLMFGAIQNE